MFHQRLDWRFVLGVVVMVTIAAVWSTSCNGGGDLEPVSPISPVVVATRPPAESPTGGEVVTWDYPGDAGPGYITFVYTSEVKARSWRLYADVELRRPTGEIMASQTIDTGRQGPDSPGTGDFEVVQWHWNLSGLPAERLEEWSRTRWSSPGEPDVLGIFFNDEGAVVDRDEAGYSFRRHVWGQGWSVYLPKILRGYSD